MVGEQNNAPSSFVRRAIGQFDVSVAGNFEEALGDFAELYEGYPQGDEAETPIRMKIRGSRRGLLGARRYAIDGDGEEVFTDRKPNEVLPYLEWGINWQVVRHCPESLQLHAAAMARGDVGVLLVGGSGSGKSTLAAGLLARGWRYLTDELAMVDPETLRVRGFPKALCVKRGAFEVMEQLELPLWRRRHYVKAFKGQVGYVNPQQAGRGAVGGSMSVNLIVLPRYVGGDRPWVERISPAQAVFSLTGQTLNRNEFGARAARVLGELTSQARCYRLGSAGIEATSEAVEELLASGC